MEWSNYIDPVYMYNAKCNNVFDGDTCRLTIDLGFGMFMNNKSIRLFGINTPELYKGTLEEKSTGKLARDFLREKIVGKDIILYSIKDKEEKYGRILGIIFIKNENGVLVNINQLLIDEGHATIYLIL